MAVYVLKKEERLTSLLKRIKSIGVSLVISKEFLYIVSFYHNRTLIGGRFYQFEIKNATSNTFRLFVKDRRILHAGGIAQCKRGHRTLSGVIRPHHLFCESCNALTFFNILGSVCEIDLTRTFSLGNIRKKEKLFMCSHTDIKTGEKVFVEGYLEHLPINKRKIPAFRIVKDFASCTVPPKRRIPYTGTNLYMFPEKEHLETALPADSSTAQFIKRSYNLI